jgi:hypothetical protein
MRNEGSLTYLLVSTWVGAMRGGVHTGSGVMESRFWEAPEKIGCSVLMVLDISTVNAGAMLL